jgi:hypothetical protein
MRSAEMIALSIQQPWAWLIVQGHKDIENRTWPTSYRGKILIHAGKRYAKYEFEDDAITFGFRFSGFPETREEMTGGIVGMATLVDCVQESDSQWFYGPYGFVLRDARPLPFVPFRGQLGFFDVPDDLVLRETFRADFEAAMKEEETNGI